MDYGKAFTYVFEDPDWVKKVLIGGAIYLGGFVFGFLLLIPSFISIFLIAGYMIETVQNVVAGKERPLPDWDNWQDKIRKGGVMSLIVLVYTLPLWILVIPFIAIMALSGQGSNSDMSAVGVFSICGFYLIFFVYILFINIIYPALVIKYATTEEFAAAFRFSEILSFIRSNLGPYVIVILLTIAANWIRGLGAIACYIGMFFTMFYAQLIDANLFGQLYLNAQR